MRQRIRAVYSRSPTRTTESYLKFLKPGALAQLRDSRISARSYHHRVINLLPPPQISSTPSTITPSNNAGQQSQVNVTDGLPCFSSRFYGTRCPQRKKLVAAKTVLFLGDDSVE